MTQKFKPTGVYVRRAEPKYEWSCVGGGGSVSASEARKTYPLYTGLLRYFPDALMEVAHVSYMGSKQHHPDQPLHWDKNKSTDELDALMRHLKDAGTRDTDGERHSAKIAWRALANLQREIEAEQGDIVIDDNWDYDPRKKQYVQGSADGW